MPTGVYKRTEKHREIISEVLRGNKNRKGIPHSDKIKKKLSEWMKEHPNSGQFKKGQTPWNNGIPMSEKAKKKLSLSCMGRPSGFKGKKHTVASKKKMSLLRKGKPTHFVCGENNPTKRPEVRAKMSEARKGRKLTQEWKDKIAASMKGKHSADKNPAWKGGISHKNREARRELKQWRLAVFHRDDFTCQDCGAKGNLNAHHLKSFADYPKLRLEISNGRTLCVPCHKRLHKSYNF